MATINSYTLFHITHSFSILKKIITKGLRYSYSLEKTDTETAIIQEIGHISGFSDRKLQENRLKGNPETNVAIPMICFCDIPLLRIEDHCKKYGKFAIGLDKELISDLYNNQINPIWYLESKNTCNFKKNYSIINYYNQKYICDLLQDKHFLDDLSKDKKSINILIKNMIKYENTETFVEKVLPKTPEPLKSLMEITVRNMNTKILSNYILGYTKPRIVNNTSYYDEREWRGLLPDDEDIAKWKWDIDQKYFDLHKKEWNDSLDKNKEFGHIILTSELLNDAITHIIVDTDKKIPDVINYIMKTKSIFGASDISREQRLILISKITSFERINKDY